MSRPTIGQYVLDNFHKPEDSLDPVEVRSTIRSDDQYLKELEQACHNFILKHKHQGDFFVAVLKKKERVLLGRAYRNYFVGRFSCPTPNYDMDAWHYRAKIRKCELVFSLGDRNSTIDMVRFPTFYAQHQPDLLHSSILFMNGGLMKKVLELNGESAILSPHDAVNRIPLIIPA